MANVHEFSAESIQQALDAITEHGTMATEVSAQEATPFGVAGGEFSVLAQCLSVKVVNHRICLGLPLGLGNICLPIPLGIPNGTAAEACLSICTTWGFPTGVKVTIRVAGRTIITKSFGKC